jgi:hypothetical protein
MTEKQWRTESRHPQEMADRLGDFGFPRTKNGRRKLRLFACACCRVAWDVFPDDRLRAAVETAERFAGGLATKDELSAAHAAIHELAYDSGPFGRARAAVRVAIDMAIAATDTQAYSSAFSMTAQSVPLAGALTEAKAEAYQCGLIRCIFGNPFRPPPAFNKAWRTSAVVALARGVYDGRAFDRLPILADALQDAGCDDADVLGHCRGPGPHARGCWVVDAVLGTSDPRGRRPS